MIDSTIKAFSFVLIFFFGWSQATICQTASADNNSETTIVKHQLKVRGASCKTDLGMIVSKVKKLEGVKACEIVKRGAISTLQVEYHSRRVDFQKIKAAIESTGTCEDPDARRYKVKL